jgi:hypothetical protein
VLRRTVQQHRPFERKSEAKRGRAFGHGRATWIRSMPLCTSDAQGLRMRLATNNTGFFRRRASLPKRR